jgi:[acyl-carrier-protein] S-malonyltransferase
MSIGFLFPGQGAQSVGMMADIVAASPAAKAVFDQADAALGFSLSQMCFAGPEERLNATDINQPAIFVSSIATLAAMKESLGDRMPAPAMMAGLSLGEYTALCAAGAIDFAAALKLVARRGRLMQEASDAAPSGMVAILGLDDVKIDELCAAAANGGILAPANYLCPGQTVVSGHAASCAKAVELAPKMGASGAIPLKVAGAFHSALMQSAADKLAPVMEATAVGQPALPVVSNVDAVPHCCPGSIKGKLIAQVTGPVKWAQSVQFMLDNGCDAFYEIGPGRVLAGLMKRISRRMPVTNVNSAEAMKKL